MSCTYADERHKCGVEGSPESCVQSSSCRPLSLSSRFFASAVIAEVNDRHAVPEACGKAFQCRSAAAAAVMAEKCLTLASVICGCVASCLPEKCR